MKLRASKILLTVIALFALNLQCMGQINEVQFRVSFNNFSFGGPGASYQTFNETLLNDPKSPIVNNPYGRNGKISFGTGLSFQRNTKSKLIFGFSASYERLLAIIKTSNGIIYDNRIILGEGSNELRLHYANLQPFVGLTLSKNESSGIELKLLSDICYLVQSGEELTFTSNEGAFEFRNDRVHPKYDFRVGLGTSIYIKQFGLNIEYLIGLKNFDPNNNSAFSDIDNTIYSTIFRFGLNYMIFKSDKQTKEKKTIL